MKKTLLVCTGLLVVAALAAAPASAQFPKCLQFNDFCDAIQVNSISGNTIDATWSSWDCAGSDGPGMGLTGVNATSPCDGSAGQAGIRFLAADGNPGDFWFLLDGLDGTMDMISGIPPGGSCWIDQLAYTVIDGACTNLAPLQPQKPALLNQ